MEDNELKDEILGIEIRKGLVKGIVKASRIRNGGSTLTQYGNSADYLKARLKRDRPDLLKQMYDEWGGRHGKEPSVYKYAKLAGIIVPDDTLTKLFKLWDKSDLETRQIFVGLCWEEIEAAKMGIHLDKSIKVHPGPNPEHLNAEPIPDLEALLKKGWTLSAIAKGIETSYRTVTGWRSGRSKPRKNSLEKLSKLLNSLT